jgi:hypothetical protein
MELEVKNAGLVLVFPFLKRFFEACGLLENSLFASEQSAVVATRSLNYLATNDDQGEHGIYLLPKLICGIGIQMVIEDDQPLPDNIKLESRELLMSVISHWKVLNGSSIESLQIFFLQRRGLLVMDENEINVRIEKRAFDILLEQLPWTFSLFKFPWISPLIKTDW